MITPQDIARELDKFPVEYMDAEKIQPEYRRFTCFGCGRYISKAWHIHYESSKKHRELHLCKKCGLKYNLKVK